MHIAHQRQTNVARKGFTLVGLVVVILLLGIIAAIAAPKMFDTVDDARTKTAIQSLAIIRDAIEMHRSRTGAFPGDAGTQGDFTADMTAFLKGPFPSNPLTVAIGDGSVKVENSGAALTASGAQDWKYDNTTGDFIINTTGFHTF